MISYPLDSAGNKIHERISNNTKDRRSRKTADLYISYLSDEYPSYGNDRMSVDIAPDNAVCTTSGIDTLSAADVDTDVSAVSSACIPADDVTGLYVFTSYGNTYAAKRL